MSLSNVTIYLPAFSSADYTLRLMNAMNGREIELNRTLPALKEAQRALCQSGWKEPEAKVFEARRLVDPIFIEVLLQQRFPSPSTSVRGR